MLDMLDAVILCLTPKRTSFYEMLEMHVREVLFVYEHFVQ